MFIYPSKPVVIYDPEKFIETLKSLGKLSNYRVQVKKNGSRALPEIEQKIRIFDRNNSTLTISVEKDWSPLSWIFPLHTLADGELIGRKQGDVSDRLYLWDMPYCGGTNLTQVSYDERYQELRHLVEEYVRVRAKISQPNGKPFALKEDPEWIHGKFGDITIGVAKSWPAEQWQELLEAVNYTGSTGENEGIVFKDITHPLSWNPWKTRDIKEQVKFLLKYKK